jgi:predicted CoA-binding protein
MAEGRILTAEEDLAAAVRAIRSVAVIGMKGELEPDAEAFRIPKALQERGIRIIPVNPKLREALGERAYGSIGEVPDPFDAVDVFRRSSAIVEVADAILGLASGRRPRLVWLQLGIRHDEAAARLAAAGIDVVQDRCLMVETAKYRGVPG